MSEQKYNVIRGGLVLLDYGPITMTLEARLEGRPFSEAAEAGAKKALEVFDGLVEYLNVIKTPVCKIAPLSADAPQAVLRMIESVSSLHEDEFTPLAAVAGTVSDMAVEEMSRCGADYAVVNNGGDIAWRISDTGKKSFRVGLISDIRSGVTTHKLEVDSFKQICGIATSGMGGRSLTRGIASAVTALACTSSKADAAATSIANACFCDDPAIIQCLAEEIDYDTDIRGLMVTKSVGDLDKKSIAAALKAGKDRAESLVKSGLILGAIIFVSGQMALVRKGSVDSLFDISKI
ncbi:MAG: UPF0280 family protein [Synergistaceae bacterium]|nr:UPF0280 family protein [Synergistaceae bacterium]